MKDPQLSNNHIKNNNNKIALIGHMGSGKSVIGSLLSKRLNFQHIDSDKMIEKETRKTIKEIFNDNGEHSFREIEEKIILKFKFKKNIVVSLGGGAILSKNVRELLKKEFLTIFLDIDLNILSERLKKSNKRPLIIGKNISEKLKQLDTTRRKYYLMANIIIKKNLETLDTVESLLKSIYCIK